MIKIKNKTEKIIYVFLFIGIIVLASLPSFRNGIYNGFDLWFHMGRIESIATELSNGQIPVRYETQSWYGNGYISSNMYGNLFLYIPALLHMAGMATYRCYNIYVIMINTLGVLVCAYSFYGLFKDKYWTFFSTAMYMLAGYYLSNVYMRSAVGEYTAMIFIPLVIYGMYRIYFETIERSVIGKVLPLVLGATGIIQSHILTTVLVAMAIILFAIVYFKDSIKNLRVLLLALVLVVGINAFFIIPFLDSYTSYTFNASVETVGDNIQKHGLHLGQLLGLFPEGSGKRVDWSSEGKEYLRIGFLHVLSLFMMIVLMVFRKRFITSFEERKSFKAVVVVFFIGVLAAWLSSVYFPWGIFSGDNFFSNMMRGIQYPSRYLVIQTVCWNICGVYAFKTMSNHIFIEKQNFYKCALVLMIGTIALFQTGIFMYTLSCRNITVQRITDHESMADALYLKVGTQTENLVSKAIALDDNANVEDLGYAGKWRRIHIENHSGSTAEVLIPIFDYKYIHAFDSKNKEIELESTENNQYKINVATGFDDTIRVGFVEPFMWRLSELISAVMIVLIIVMSIYQKRNGMKNA